MIRIFVPDTPRPGGSKKAFFNRKTGKPIIVPDNPHTANWRNSVMFYARQQYKGEPLEGPLAVQFSFFMERPRTHFGTGKNKYVLKLTAPRWHTNKPDLTKLIRSTEDALTGIMWADDSQVCYRTDRKVYLINSEEEGVEIVINTMESFKG